jgi:hypothetical protein
MNHPNLESIISNGVKLTFVTNDTSELAYPAIQYAEKGMVHKWVTLWFG